MKQEIAFFILVLVMFSMIFLLPSHIKKTTEHFCKYTNCPFSQGTAKFTEGCGNCFPDSDCWKLDSIHFYNPSLDYDGCDSILNK